MVELRWTPLSSERILARYYGQDPSTENLPALPSAGSMWGSDLTPLARYLAKRARRKLVEQEATDSKPTEEQLRAIIDALETEEGERLSDEERHAVIASLSAALDDYGILTPLVENARVNDIIISSYRDISVQIDRQNYPTGLTFPDQESYRSFVENLLKRAGKSCTVATPVVDAAIDSNVRACVTHESFSPNGLGPMLTLRIARHRNISLDQLSQMELAPHEVMNYLAALVRSGQVTMLIAGEVGSGKTTLIRALAGSVRPEEAILTIEDTHELSLERSFVRTLLTREANSEGAGRITPAQAIRAGMRMAMNRIILGEMRDAEAAEAFIDVCASGHAGLSTIHARSARDAISRLELFLARAQGSASTSTIRKQIANAVSVIVYLDVDRSCGKRRVMEILEIEGAADGAVQVAPVYEFSPREGTPLWRRCSGVTRFQSILVDEGVELSPALSIVQADEFFAYATNQRSLRCSAA